MTASSAGGSTCLTARGLDISLAALRRQDPYIKNIVDVASQVALYTFNSRLNEWEKTDVEGTLFVYTRLASPRHGFTIQNRLSMDNLTEPITKDLDFQLQDPFLLYRNARLAIHGVWFYDKQDCQRIAQLMKNLTQQEQVLAQPQPQPQLQGWRSPGTMEGGGKGGGEGEGKGVDILQMLTNARCDYDKGGKPEPKEILCSTLRDNPNLIKPIPVKPTSQDSEGTEPRQLSLATLFGSQPPCLDPYSPRGQPQPGAVRPAVARSLSYEDPDGKVIPGSTRTGVPGERGPPEMWPLVGTGVGTEYAGGGHKAGDGSAPTGPNQPQQQQQHCPAIQKLMTPSQGQRGAGELLQAVSQSSEIRLWQNGAPLLHPHPHRQHQHQQHHLVYQHLHHHHHHQPHQQPFHSPSPSQTRPDPIQRLFQNQPPMSSSVPSTTATLCGSHPPPPLPQQPPVLPALQAAQPRLVDSQGYGQPQQPVFYSPSRPQGPPPPQPIVPAGPDPTPLGTDLPLAMQAGLQPHLPGIASLPGVFHPTSAQVPALSGQISGMPGPLQGVQGVVSPHELLQRLQLVQQEQRQGPTEPPRPSPGLAPRFPAAGPSTAGLSAAPASGQYSSANLAQRAGLQLQVISPQRIPATVAPTTLLLSPSVFSQSKAPPPQTDSGPPPSGPRAPPPGSEDTVALSRSQLQATLLHLIQTDSSFLDTIYSSYISRLTHDKGSTKY